MTITDVSELVIEAAEYSGQSDLPTHAPMFLGFLEARLNKELRVDQMVAETSLTTDANGLIALPSDYEEAIDLTYGDKYPLKRLSKPIHDESVRGYYISGGNLISSEVSTAHALRYYQSIPGLWSNGTNWLLTAKPEVYLWGLVVEALKKAKAMESLGPAVSMFDLTIGELKASDIMARRNDTVVMPRTQI